MDHLRTVPELHWLLQTLMSSFTFITCLVHKSTIILRHVVPDLINSTPPRKTQEKLPWVDLCYEELDNLYCLFNQFLGSAVRLPEHRGVHYILIRSQDSISCHSSTGHSKSPSIVRLCRPTIQCWSISSAFAPHGHCKFSVPRLARGAQSPHVLDHST